MLGVASLTSFLCLSAFQAFDTFSNFVLILSSHQIWEMVLYFSGMLQVSTIQKTRKRFAKMFKTVSQLLRGNCSWTLANDSLEPKLLKCQPFNCPLEPTKPFDWLIRQEMPVVNAAATHILVLHYKILMTWLVTLEQSSFPDPNNIFLD